MGQVDGAGAIRDAQWVITAYSEMVYRLAYAMMKNQNDADDIYQEVFLRYIRRKPAFQSQEHARAGLLRRRSSTVRTQLTRVRELLREILKKCGYDEIPPDLFYFLQMNIPVDSWMNMAPSRFSFSSRSCSSSGPLCSRIRAALPG